MARGNSAAYRRRKRFRMIYITLSAILVLAAVVAGCVLFFQVNEVEVLGTTRYSEEQILAAAEIPENANVLLFPDKEVEARLMETFPYIGSVKVERGYPSTVQIVIVESEPVAAIQMGEEYWLIDTVGKVLEKAEEDFASPYIQVIGIALIEPEPGQPAQAEDGSAARLKGLCSLLYSLQFKAVMERAMWVDLSLQEEIQMGFDGRFTVRLPISSDSGNKEYGYNRKIDTLLGIVEQLDEYDRGIIDLRYVKMGYFRAR